MWHFSQRVNILSLWVHNFIQNMTTEQSKEHNSPLWDIIQRALNFSSRFQIYFLKKKNTIFQNILCVVKTVRNFLRYSCSTQLVFPQTNGNSSKLCLSNNFNWLSPATQKHKCIKNSVKPYMCTFMCMYLIYGRQIKITTHAKGSDNNKESTKVGTSCE